MDSQKIPGTIDDILKKKVMGYRCPQRKSLRSVKFSDGRLALRLPSSQELLKAEASLFSNLSSVEPLSEKHYPCRPKS